MTTDRPGFLALPHADISTPHIKLTDRIADLGAVIVYFNNTHLQIHVYDAAQAHALAAVFAEAAGLLDAAAAGECTSCGALLPGHTLSCSRHVARAVTE